MNGRVKKEVQKGGLVNGNEKISLIDKKSCIFIIVVFLVNFVILLISLCHFNKIEEQLLSLIAYLITCLSICFVTYAICQLEYKKTK
jgi:hypothetical protein